MLFDSSISSLVVLMPIMSISLLYSSKSSRFFLFIYPELWIMLSIPNQFAKLSVETSKN